MTDMSDEGQRTDIPTGAMFFFVAYMLFMCIWDFIVGIPKAITNCFVADLAKKGMIPMVDKPIDSQDTDSDKVLYTCHNNKDDWVVFYQYLIALICFAAAYIFGNYLSGTDPFKFP